MVLGLLLSLLIVAEPPRELRRLVIEARVAATSNEGKGAFPRELEPRANAIIGYGEQAIPLVMPLLQHPSPGVRRFFGYVVAELPGLGTAELAPLIAAYRGGNDRVARAIGNIDSPMATAFLAETFAANPERHSLLGFELSRLGARGAAALVPPLRGKAVSAAFGEAACELFRSLGVTSATDPELLSIFRTEKLPAANRIAALTLIACIPPVSDEARAAVDAAVRSSKALEPNEKVDQLQRGLGTADGIAMSLARLTAHPEEVGMLAAGGQSARAAEPTVLSLLQNERAGIRLEAIITLGALGGEAAIVPLEQLLTDARDWRAPCAAARALAQLGSITSKTAIEGGERVAWYPVTAECMKAAGRALQNGRPPTPDEFLWKVPDATRLRPQPTTTLGPDELDPIALKRLKVTGKIESWGEHGIHIQNVTAAPLFALRIDGGVLAGTNRGEWGGEFALLRSGAGQQVLLEENVAGIHRVGSQIVVVTGLAHKSMNDGMIFRVARTADGSLKASEWRVLPGAPLKSFVLANGRLFVSCNGADLVIDEAGTIAIATAELVR